MALGPVGGGRSVELGDHRGGGDQFLGATRRVGSGDARPAAVRPVL